MSRPDILLRAGLSRVYKEEERKDAARLTKYLRAWADILTESGAEDVAQPDKQNLQAVTDPA